jgi:hypothetical protein
MSLRCRFLLMSKADILDERQIVKICSHRLLHLSGNPSIR